MGILTQIKTYGTFVTIINNSTNTSSLARGIFAHCTQNLINQAKKEASKYLLIIKVKPLSLSQIIYYNKEVAIKKGYSV